MTTYVSAADAARLIRAALESRHGWTSRQVSVKSESYSMGSSINIVIKVPGIPISAVEEIANSQERIHRDDNGEILGGGNRYVSVSLDWDLIHRESEKLISWIEETPVHPSQLRAVSVCGDIYLIGRTHPLHGYSVHRQNNGYIPTSQTAGGVADFFARVMIQAGVEVAPPPAIKEEDVPLTVPPSSPAPVTAASAPSVPTPVTLDTPATPAAPALPSPAHTTTREDRRATSSLLRDVQEAAEDFEWYPTTRTMIEVVSRHLDKGAKSLLDIGAGDGRVLKQLSSRFIEPPKLYSIEKSHTLIRAQGEDIIPVGTDLFEQSLESLRVDYIFCNPPYSQYAVWASMIIDSGYARAAYLILPQRWKEEESIRESLKKRGARARVIHSGDFLDAPRKARAVIDTVEIYYPRGHWGDKPKDPFDIWFDENISTFAPEEKSYSAEQEAERQELARLHSLNSITSMVEAYREEYARMEENYRAIFKLDYSLLKELGVNKENVRDGIKLKMVGLKSKYWKLLFDRLDAVTDRLSTKTKKEFLDKLLGQVVLAFTADNAYAVVIWAIKNANAYFDAQTKELFLDLSGFENVYNYKSNIKTWKKSDWRYMRWDDVEAGSKPSRYALDYRVVLDKYRAIAYGGDSVNNLDKGCHEMVADVIAVLFNLGFPAHGENSLERIWEPGEWQNWYRKGDHTEVLFQVKAHKNGNLHFRFLPAAIKTLNVEAGRLLGWLKAPADVVEELGYTQEEAEEMYRCTRTILPGTARLLLGTGEAE